MHLKVNLKEKVPIHTGSYTPYPATSIACKYDSYDFKKILDKPRTVVEIQQ